MPQKYDMIQDAIDTLSQRIDYVANRADRALTSIASLKGLQVVGLPEAKLSGGLIIPETVGTDALVDAAITEVKLAEDAVTAAKLAADAVTADAIATSAITSTKIADNAITSPKILAGAVIAGKIGAAAVTANEIAANSITSTKIQADAVVASAIAAGAVIAGKIAAGAIQATDIAAGAITASKLETNLALATTIQLAAGGKIVDGDGSFWDQTGITLNSPVAQSDVIKFTSTLTPNTASILGVISSSSTVFGMQSRVSGVNRLADVFVTGSFSSDASTTVVLRASNNSGALTILSVGADNSVTITGGGNTTTLFNSSGDMTVNRRISWGGNIKWGNATLVATGVMPSAQKALIVLDSAGGNLYIPAYTTFNGWGV